MGEVAWVAAVVVAVASPGGAAALLALRLLAGGSPAERGTDRLVRGSLSLSLLATVVAALGLVRARDHHVVLSLGTWFGVGEYGFEATLLVDELAIAMMLLTATLVGLVGMFSTKYLHRQAGYHRFFLLLLVFAAGMMLVATAGTLDMFFVGWELVGLGSTLLIAYHWDRPGPVEGGLRALMTYRLCDVGLLAAGVLVHHALGTASFATLFGGRPWPAASLHPGLAGHATELGLLLVLAAIGKSAQVPSTGWLPLAMEGPTPSSAIFYGALSVHAGAFLLLRCAPVFESSPVARGVLALVGATTFVHASFVGRVQTKGKILLAYSSAAQLGLIFVEVALGFRYLALAHVLGHATLRTLQFLRAPSMLSDRLWVEGLGAGELPQERSLEAHLDPETQHRLYRLHLERGYLDATLLRLLVAPVEAVGGFVDGVDRALARLLGAADEERP